MDVLSRKALPVVGIGSLVLGGACDDGGFSSTRVAQNFCAFEFECDRDDFDYYFTSIDACVVEVSAEIESELSYYEREYGAGCAAAFRTYYSCVGRAYANIGCGEEAYVLCADEYARVVASCDF